MNRRDFSKAGLGALGLSAGVQSAMAATSSRAFYELRTYELRYDLDSSRINNFLEQHYVPELKRRTGGPVGVFNIVQGQLSPALVVLLQYESFDNLLANTDLAKGSDGFSRAWKEFESKPMPYIRYHSNLLKSFASHPQIEKPTAGKRGNLFELRTYESKDAVKSAAKIGMFNEEEIKIFRDCSMMPVFFGEGIFGARLPLLTYMVAFKDVAAREKAWSVFRTNADWNRIKADPRWTDTVSNIHASFLSPASYSDIR